MALQQERLPRPTQTPVSQAKHTGIGIGTRAKVRAALAVAVAYAGNEVAVVDAAVVARGESARRDGWLRSDKMSGHG